MELLQLLFIFVLAAFLGYELIKKVPSQLHPPLMSGSNAISGITIVGAILVLKTGTSEINTVIGVAAEGFKGMMPGLIPDLYMPVRMWNELNPGGGDRLARRGWDRRSRPSGVLRSRAYCS